MSTIQRTFQQGERLRAAQLNRLAAGVPFVLDAAETARILAERRVGLVFSSVADAQAKAAALQLEAGTVIATLCFASPGDGGGATYIRVLSEPWHEGKFYSDGWWELFVAVVRAEMFGSVVSGSGDAWAACQAAANYGARVNGEWELLSKTYLISQPIVVPRANGSGGVSGTVKRFKIRGTGGVFPDAGTMIKASGAMDALMATEAWATNTIAYQSGWALAGVTLDGSNLAVNGIATTAADVSLDGVYIRYCTGVGLWHTRYLQNGTLNTTRPDRCRFNQLMIRDCGVGFQSLNSADCTFTLSEIWHCGVCMDVNGSGWQFDNIRTYSNYATQTYMVRFVFGQGCRVTNCVFGGASGRPDIYQVEIRHRFDPIYFTGNEISGPAGKGVRCITDQANGRGLVVISECTFTNEAGATTCAVWCGTNDADFAIDVVDCVFRIGIDDFPFEWDAGAEAGKIFARNCRRIDASAQGGAVIYEGIQRPGILATNNPGVLVSGANPVTFTYESKRSAIRNLPLSSATAYVMPADAGEGQIFEVARSFAATGDYILTIYQSDAVTPITTLPVPGWYARLMYAPTVTPPWVVVENGPVEQPDVYGVNLPGITVAGGGLNPYTFTGLTKRTVIRNAALTSDLSFILPATGGEGQEYTIIRTAAATGIFAHNIYLSDGVTLVKSIAVPSFRVKVSYAPTLGGWIVTEATAIT